MDVRVARTVAGIDRLLKAMPPWANTLLWVLLRGLVIIVLYTWRVYVRL